MLTQIVRRLLLSDRRGAYRAATSIIDVTPSLHALPLRFGDWPPVFVDLRQPKAQEWLRIRERRTCPQEPEVQTVLRRIVRPGDLVVDVGANEGLHTVLLSLLVGETGEVLSVEPNPDLLPCLRRTLAALPNVTLHEVACGEMRGNLDLHIPRDHSRASFAVWTTPLGEGVDHVHTVPVVPLTSLLPRTPDVVKVDVEGAELSVFTGAREILDRPDAPIVLFEELELAARAMGHSPTAAADFLACLAKPDFRFFMIDDSGELVSIPEERNNWFDILAVPASRMDRVRESTQFGDGVGESR